MKTTNENKLSLWSAFKKIYGEILESMGFRLLQSKYPYFVRVLDSGIVHTVSMDKQTAMNKDFQEFELCIGVSLICFPFVDFDKRPMAIENQTYMMDIRSFHHSYSLHFDAADYQIEHFSFGFRKGNKSVIRICRNLRGG